MSSGLDPNQLGEDDRIWKNCLSCGNKRWFWPDKDEANNEYCPKCGKKVEE